MAKLSPSVADAVRRVVAPAVDQAGLYLEEVKLTSDGSTPVVRVVLDLPENELGALGSDRLDPCARAISAALDADDVVPGAYNLEVSTPGVSRPLTTARHFRRARGRVVEVVRSTGVPIKGRLLDVLPGPAPTGDAKSGALGDTSEGARASASPAASECAEPGETLVFDTGARVPLAEVTKGKVKVELKKIDDAVLGAEFGGSGQGGSEGE